MAMRPVFVADRKTLGVQTVNVDFKWSAGYALSQTQKNIQSLHDSFHGIQGNSNKKILEISTGSNSALGVSLSAFNLKDETKITHKTFSVESAFQSSKVFEYGGPYTGLLYEDAKKIRKDKRLINSGKLRGFNFFGKDMPTYPLTLFYDWLYINILKKNDEENCGITAYDAFSDIMFNPNKSINCQAFSAALYVSMICNNIDLSDIKDIDTFMKAAEPVYRARRLRPLD